MFGGVFVGGYTFFVVALFVVVDSSLTACMSFRLLLPGYGTAAPRAALPIDTRAALPIDTRAALPIDTSACNISVRPDKGTTTSVEDFS